MADRVSSAFGRWKILVRGFARTYARDLAHVAWTHNPSWLLIEWDQPTADRSAGPAPGHPEALAAHVPLSKVERALWAQLSRT
jgi:uncharacterized protein DUF6059